MTDEHLLKKKARGAPRGNRNALKHGFYSRYMRKTDLEDVDLLSEAEGGMNSLVPEILLLRIQVRRLLESIQEAEAQGKELDWLACLNGLGLASLRIAKLLRTQKSLAEDQASNLSGIISQALSDIAKELKL